jgi:hypothetical protein
MEADQPLSVKAIEKFKAIYLDEFSRRLTDDEARSMAQRVLRLFDLLARQLSTPSP